MNLSFNEPDFDNRSFFLSYVMSVSEISLFTLTLCDIEDTTMNSNYHQYNL